MTDIFIASKNKNEKHSPRMTYSEKVSAFSNFCKNPQGVSFQTQKHGESIILFLRSHLITNITWVLISFALLFLPILIIALFKDISLSFIPSENITRFAIIFTIFYYLMVFSYAFLSFLNWFYNIFLVTTERIVDIDYSDIVVHNIAITNLGHVEDVNYTQSGFIPTIINFGNLFVQTAGTERNFEALSVPKPREATHIIGDLIEKKK